MKRKLLYVFVLAIFTTSLAYSQYIEDTLTVNRTEDVPYIDGYADWEWDLEEFYTITEWGEDDNDEPHAPDETDCIAKYKMLWDDDYLYFLGVVVDDTVADQSMLTDAAAPTWETDSWEFYIAPTLSKLESMDEMTQIRWSFASADAEDGTTNVVNGWSSGGYTFSDFGYAVRTRTDDGWVLEASFALASFAEKLEDIDAYAAGDLIGWQITVSDSDGQTNRDWIGSWIPDTQWDHADTLGILKLGANLTGFVDTTDVVDTTDITGIKMAQQATQINIYPNPVTESLHFAGKVKIETIEIFNSLGAMVIRETNVMDAIDVSNLQTGFYFVKVHANNGLLETHRFMKE